MIESDPDATGPAAGPAAGEPRARHETGTVAAPEQRHHVRSRLMRESLLDRQVERSTESPVFRMLPEAHVLKIGGRSILDEGRQVVYPVVAALADCLKRWKLILGTGGGVRTRHVFSIGIDLGLPTGVLAQLAAADALGNAHILGTLLAPHGVVAIPPEIFGHLLPLFLHSAPGVVFSSVPPYSLWEHPPGVGRIPPHRTDAGAFLLAECFGCKSLTLVKDVDGLYDADPKLDPSARLIPEITVTGLRRRGLATLPFEPILLDLLANARLLDRFQLVNGRHPERIQAALAGEHVGTIVHRDP
ncbi:MAG TPA: uridylate kinase [Thermoanaerobaculia bacterium]|nr:uridylate kinase [Thermoanaerobaculia bacterium]